MNGYIGVPLNQATTTSTSATVNIFNLTNVSGVVVSSGTMNGTISFQVSNDFDTANDLAAFIPVNWATITSTVASTTAGANTLIPQVVTSYHYLRAQFTVASGQGTVSVYVKGNGY